MCIRQGYDQSLFERMMKCGYPVNILKIQYRMHPYISRVIGNVFYGGMLQDSPNVISATDKHVLYDTLSPFMFINVPRSS
jgi:senataxin